MSSNPNSYLDFDDTVTHTLSVELKDGSSLLYRLTEEAKNLFYVLLSGTDYDDSFIWFYAGGDRLVFINKSELIRITFLFDYNLSDTGNIYCDNFGYVHKSFTEEPEPEDEESEGSQADQELTEQNDADAPIPEHVRKWYSKEYTQNLPSLIIKHRGEPVDYSSNPSICRSLFEYEISGIDIDTDSKQCMTCSYLNFNDDDGEDNFMPMENIIIIEVERQLLLEEDVLNLLLEKKVRRPSKKTNTKK